MKPKNAVSSSGNKSWVNRKNIVIPSIIVIVVIIIGFTAVVAVGMPRVEVSDEVRKSADFAIVLPRQVPKNFSVTSEPSYDSDNHIVTTSLKNQSGLDVTISQQKKPDINLKQIDTKETYLTDVGSVYILKGEPGRLQAIIETEDSWIMVNCDDSIELSTFKDIITSLATDH